MGQAYSKYFKAPPMHSEGMPSESNESKECSICINTFPNSTTYWKTLKCSHTVCKECFKQLKKSGTTMAGKSHTFLKCPFCLASTGVEIGTCPNGTMTVTEMSDTTPGYEQYTTLRIQYYCPGTPGLNRYAYVPNSLEGRQVVELLKQAWDRRLCFSIGTSVTTGLSNVVVWNIHHKSSITGGTENYGYPDPTYFTRVKCELSQYGIA